MIISKKKLVWFATCILLVLLFLIWLYTHPASSTVKLLLFKRLNLPVGYAYGSVIRYSEFAPAYEFSNNLQNAGINQAWKIFTQSKGLAYLASQQKLTPSAAEIAQDAALPALASAPSGEVRKFSIVTNINRRRLAAAWVKQEFQKDRRYKMLADILKVNSQADFSALTMKYSEDSASKSFGGGLGFVQKNSLLPEVVSSVDFSKVERPQIVYSRYGAHVIFINAVDTQDLLEPKYDVYQIFFKVDGFDQYLEKKLAQEKNIFLLD
ncbi:MAG TPA: peptidylprolyl isomerase [Patescibacteria group bacterium]|nr:peptidylprolyl isomerase [Patescibacteria group bacterium]